MLPKLKVTLAQTSGNGQGKFTHPRAFTLKRLFEILTFAETLTEISILAISNPALPET